MQRPRSRQSIEENRGKTYRREYTLNEIFENVKNFKRQAKEQEMLSSQVNSNVPTTRSISVERKAIERNDEHVYVNQRMMDVPKATFVWIKLIPICLYIFVILNYLIYCVILIIDSFFIQ